MVSVRFASPDVCGNMMITIIMQKLELPADGCNHDANGILKKHTTSCNILIFKLMNGVTDFNVGVYIVVTDYPSSLIQSVVHVSCLSVSNVSFPGNDDY